VQQRHQEVSTYPLSMPLPELNNGPHFGYAVQWMIFTILTAGAYVLVLRKKSLEVTGSD
jgi:cytochrome oxidase assembly protein ShyY1